MRARILALGLLAFTLGCKVPTEGTGNTTGESTDSSGDSTDASDSSDSTEAETDATTNATTEPGTTDAETTDATTSDATTEQTTTSDTSETTDETGSETDDPVDTFDDAMQWYCGGQCSPTSPPVGTLEGCEPEDAHAFCQVLTNNPDSVATFWEQAVAVDGPGFCCLGLGPVYENVLDWDEVCYSSDSLFPDHEGGSVILREGLECE